MENPFLTSVTPVVIPGLGKARIFAKCEFETPSGSHKYRVYQSSISGLEKMKKIYPGMTLIDYSSGNGGIALAQIAKEKGYHAKIVVPKSVNREKIEKAMALGAEIIFISTNAPYGYYGHDDLLKARLKAAQLAQENGYFFIDQANNPLNIEGCMQIGREFAKQLDNLKVVPDFFVCGIGTGGAISGTGRILKEQYKHIKIIGVEPAESNTVEAKISGHFPSHGSHGLAGLGAGDLTGATDISLISQVILVSEAEWKQELKGLLTNGYYVGKSSAANIVAIKKIKQSNNAATFVTIFFDSFSNYESEFSKPNKESEQDKVIQNYFSAWETHFQGPLVLRTKPDSSISFIMQDLPSRALIASAPCGDFINEEELVKAGFRIDGYDISKAILTKAKKKAHGAKLKRFDILSKKLPKKYDAIISLHFSMHLSDEALITFLEHCYESLNPNGKIYFNFFTPEDDLAKIHVTRTQNFAIIGNRDILLKFRTKEEIETLIQQTGFNISGVIPYENTEEPHYDLTTVSHTHRGFLVVLQKSFSTIEEAIDYTKQGKPIIILDHRENEGDFFMAAQRASKETINFMTQYGRGVLCAVMLPPRFKELEIKSATDLGMNSNETRFGESIDYLIGTTTGVSASDRAKTILAVADSNTKPYQIRRNGHVRTLEAQSVGIQGRQGHTEAAIELAQLAGFFPAGAIIEILEKDGTMAREKSLIELAKNHSLSIIKIGQLERFVKKWKNKKLQ